MTGRQTQQVMGPTGLIPPDQTESSRATDDDALGRG